MEVKSPNIHKEGDLEDEPKGLVVRIKNFVEGEELESELTPEGKTKFKKAKDVKRGRKSKNSGNQFEGRVRSDLESKGWIVDKWSNNVDLEVGKIVPAKRKFNPFSKVMTIGTGFPDFLAFQRMSGDACRVIGVEVKMNGTLSKVEKEKCKWYLESGVFSQILVACKRKEKNRVVVEYIDVKEILERMR